MCRHWKGVSERIGSSQKSSTYFILFICQFISIPWGCAEEQLFYGFKISTLSYFTNHENRYFMMIKMKLNFMASQSHVIFHHPLAFKYFFKHQKEFLYISKYWQKLYSALRGAQIYEEQVVRVKKRKEKKLKIDFVMSESDDKNRSMEWNFPMKTWKMRNKRHKKALFWFLE